MHTRWLGPLGLLVVVGCDDGCSAGDDEFVWHGEHVTVYGDGLRESDACAGSLDALDAHTGVVKKFLDVDESAPYEYWWVSPDRWRELEPCPPHAFACNNGDGVALSRLLPDMHEAVHMVTYTVGDDGCPSILDEGLAEYLGDPSFEDWLPSEQYTVPEMLTEKRIVASRPSYTRAAHFVSFLVEDYGAEVVRRLCEALPRHSTLDDWEAATLEVLHTELEVLLAEYADYPICSSQQLRARLWGCSGNPDFTFVPNHDTGGFVVESDCSDSRSTNASWGDLGDAVITRLVYFPVDTWVEVGAVSKGNSGVGATFMSQQCAPCWEEPQVIRQGDDIADMYRYRAGLHEVSVFFDKRDPVRFTMNSLP